MKKLFAIAGAFFYVNCISQTYLDYAASSHINEESLKEFIRVSKLDGNSSGFNSHAKILQQIENNSAKTIAEKLKCSPENILFVNSATIANNIAILGIAEKYPKGHIITSKIEHKSVLNVCKHLEENGYQVTYLNVDRYGRINLDELKNSVTKNTCLVTIQSFNSEIGIHQNMKAISQIIRKYPKIVLHSDISQSFCKYPLDISLLDMATFSGYKIGSPKGIAALYIKDKNLIKPILFGSGNNLFPGSKPTALIASFAEAIKNYKFNLQIIERNFSVLNSEIKKIKEVYVNSIEPSHVFSVSIKGVLLKDIIERLQEYSFSSGCSCLGQGESNVKEAIDPKGEIPSCTLRISFSDKVSEKNLINFARTLKLVVENLRKEKNISDSCDNRQQNHLNSVIENLKNNLNKK